MPSQRVLANLGPDFHDVLACSGLLWVVGSSWLTYKGAHCMVTMGLGQSLYNGG